MGSMREKAVTVVLRKQIFCRAIIGIIVDKEELTYSQTSMVFEEIWQSLGLIPHTGKAESAVGPRTYWTIVQFS